MVKTIKNKTRNGYGISDCQKPIKNTKSDYAYRTRKIYKKPKTLKNYSNKTLKPIILFPHALGQTKGGVDKAPTYIKKYINKKKHKIYTVPNTGNFFKNLKDLYKMNSLIKGDKINIGGDHSMAIATIAYTLNTYPDAKIIYFDAHADINTYASSKSKQFHGMPLSFLAGLDRNKHFGFIKNTLKFENLLYIGSRCLDSYESNLIYKHNIKFIEPYELNNDFKNAMNKILTFAGESPIHISFDVDCMDKSIIPSTGTPVKGGILMEVGKEVLKQIKDFTNVVNVDITEINLDIGSINDAKKTGENTIELFKPYID